MYKFTIVFSYRKKTETSGSDFSISGNNLESLESLSKAISEIITTYKKYNVVEIKIEQN